MHRLVITAAAACGLLAAACGSSSAASTSGTGGGSSPGAGSGPGGFARNGAAGELVRISGSKLILNSQQGDVTVAVTSATTVQRTSTATLGDIVEGVCIVASGRQDSTGRLSVTDVTISAPVSGSCAAVNGGGGGGRGRPGGNGGSANPSLSPDPGRTPPPGQANTTRIRGMVTSVVGVDVTITVLSVGGLPGRGGGTSTPSASAAATPATETLVVPTTATISRSSASSTSDLQIGDCVLAIGSRDGAGVVTARSLQIQPATAAGCFAGRGGRGGFGGPPGSGGGGGTASASG